LRRAFTAPFALKVGARLIGLPLGETLLGRSASCHVVLDGPLVSRVHAKIVVASGTMVISDLGSRNGVFVNGQRIKHATPVTSGDELVVGDAALEVVDRPMPTDRDPITENDLKNTEVARHPATEAPPGSPPASAAERSRSEVAEARRSAAPGARPSNAEVTGGQLISNSLGSGLERSGSGRPGSYVPSSYPPGSYPQGSYSASSPPPMGRVSSAPPASWGARELENAGAPASNRDGRRDAGESTRTAHVFELLGNVVEKALVLGRPHDAVKLLAPHLDRVVAQAQAGSIPAETVREAAVDYMIRLAEATSDAHWVDLAFDLYGALAKPLPLPVVDRLYDLLRRVRGGDPAKLRRYVVEVQSRADRLTAPERFALKRLEGLTRLMSP
jgi:hypothetical protein